MIRKWLVESGGVHRERASEGLPLTAAGGRGDGVFCCGEGEIELTVRAAVGWEMSGEPPTDVHHEELV